MLSKELTMRVILILIVSMFLLSCNEQVYYMCPRDAQKDIVDFMRQCTAGLHWCKDYAQQIFCIPYRPEDRKTKCPECNCQHEMVEFPKQM